MQRTIDENSMEEKKIEFVEFQRECSMDCANYKS